MGSVSFSTPAMADLADMLAAGAAVTESLSAPETESAFGSQLAALLAPTDDVNAAVNPWHPQDEAESADLSGRPLGFLFAAIPTQPVPAPMDFSSISLTLPEEAPDTSSFALTTALECVEGKCGVANPVPSPKLPQEVEAFSGRLEEQRVSEPEMPNEVEVSRPVGREVAVPRPATPVKAFAPHEQQSPKEMSAVEPERSPLTASLPILQAEEQAESAAAPKAVESRPIIAEPEVPAVQTPAKGIQVRLGDDQATRVHLRVADRGGQLHFDVRAANPEVAGALREGLPGLVKSLQTSGYRTEVWRPDNALQSATPDSTGSRERSEDLPDRRRRREPADEATKTRTRRWSSALFGVTQR